MSWKSGQAFLVNGGRRRGGSHSSTYLASPGDLRCTGFAVDRDRLHPRQFLHCHPLPHSTPWRRGHISHFYHLHSKPAPGRGLTSSPSPSPRPCAGPGRSTGPRHSPTTKIAFWQPFPWWISATQALDRLTVPSMPSSSPSSKPGSGSALFKSTLYTLSAAAAIAHWVFLQPPSSLPPEHPPA